MKKLNKVAMLFATAAMASAAGAQTIDNWRNGYVRPGLEKRYQRTTAGAMPTGRLPPLPWAAMARSFLWLLPHRLRHPLLQLLPCPGTCSRTRSCTRSCSCSAATKVTYAADAFFDFDKAVLKPEGKAKLDDLAGKVTGINLEVVIAVGHTDATGTAGYNQKLSNRRAEAVKAYLVSKGIESNRIYTEGKGLTQPVADNATSEGRAKNRRVEVEVVGTRTNK